MQTTQTLGSNRGFTLIEIMVVVVILGILGAVLVPQIMDNPDKARVQAAQSDIRALAGALDYYRLDNLSYPSTDQGLEALVSKPTGFPEPKNYNPEGYIKSLKTDPLGLAVCLRTGRPEFCTVFAGRRRRRRRRGLRQGYPLLRPLARRPILMMANTVPSITKRAQRAFTLVELMIVMVIVGIIVTTIMVSLGGRDRDQELKGLARELALKLELARQETVQRNREWGLYIEEERYAFAEYDDVEEQWVELAFRPFDSEPLPEGLEVEVEAEGFTAEVLEDEDAGLPDVVVFSSGEQTPFTIRLRFDEEREPWVITSDGLSRTRATLGEPEDA